MKIFETSREIPATVEEVFGAFAPERLARWWGPAGFTNTFHTYEFKNGGRWSFTMHGPDGQNYTNENIFAAIEPFRKVVVQHVSEPKFQLTITIESTTTGSLVSWSQALENSEIAARMEHIIIPANEQNLNRLTAEILK